MLKLKTKESVISLHLSIQGNLLSDIATVFHLKLSCWWSGVPTGRVWWLMVVDY